MSVEKTFVPMTPMWETHTDKLTNRLLLGGYALFYIDTQRDTPKRVYKQTGSPPNYSFIEVGELAVVGINTPAFRSAWRVDLNSQGAFDDIIFGNILNSDGTENELYFVEFYSRNNEFQFSREGVPYPSGSGGITPSITTNNINYIDNGQFLFHNNVLYYEEDDLKTDGKIQQPITNIAIGGWTFEVPVGTTSSNYVTFEPLPEYSELPEKSPKFFVRIKCANPSAGDTQKDLCITYNDVNKFQYNQEKFTISFTAESMSGSTISAQLVLIKNYGQTSEATTLTNFTISPILQKYSASFSFGDNTGKDISDNNFLKLVIRISPTFASDVKITDFILNEGEITSPVYPYITQRQDLTNSIFDEIIPDANGMNFGLPMVYTSKGLTFDDSSVGSLHFSALSSPPSGYFLCDGTKYETNSFSQDGVPLSRLLNKIILTDNSSYITPMFGTGADYATVYLAQPDSVSTPKIILSNNSTGTGQPVRDGSIPTGFSFFEITSGYDGDLNIYSRLCEHGELINFFGQKIGAMHGSVNAYDTGFFINLIYNSANTRFVGDILIPSNINIQGLNSKGFVIGNDTQSILFWFSYNGQGTIPSHPHDINIKINIFTDCSIKDLIYIVSNAINGVKQTLVTTTDAVSSIPQGSSFLFTVNNVNYCVYFIVDGNGNKPNISGSKMIKCSLSSSDTNIRFIIAKSINLYSFSVPDARGMFFKGANQGSINDLSSSLRYSNIGNIIYGDNIGTLEYSSNREHSHSVKIRNGQLGGGSAFVDGAWIGNYQDAVVSFNGYVDAKPQNMQLNVFIKY